MSDETNARLTVRQFCEKHPWPSEAGLRWIIFNAKEKGFSQCVFRIGKRVLIDEQEFSKWIEAYRGLEPPRRKSAA